MVCRSVNVGVLMSTSFRGITYDSSSSVCPNFIQVFVLICKALSKPCDRSAVH